VASHTTIAGGIKLTLGKGGIRFTRAPNSFNRCMRRELLGQRGGGQAGVWSRFSSAAKKC